jgi:hypothetical protein
MKLGSVEWKPFEFLHEEIRNTRFLITIMNDLWLMMVVVGVFYLIIRGTEVSAILFGAINLVIGYLIGRGQSAAGLYFNSRKDGKTETELNNGPEAIMSKGTETIPEGAANES